jgi:hypothetical protein
MKKTLLFSFIFSLLMGGLSAQSLEITYNNEVITNDYEINLIGDPQDSAPIEAAIKVKNIGSASVSVKVRKYDVSILDETNVTFCWGIQCYGPGTYLSPEAVRLDSQATDSSFHGDYSHYGKQGTSTSRFTFFDEGNPSDSVSVVVNYTAGYLGINDNVKIGLFISNAYPNPATSTSFVDYKLPKSTMGATLRINSLLGVTIQDIPLDRNEGKAAIDVSKLKEGIYFYSLIVNNSITQTRKFVVKR